MTKGRPVLRRFAIAPSLVSLCLVLSAQGQFTAKVVGVSDGDTISVMHAGRATTVRLDGIDCPEDGQDFSARAKQFTSSKVLGKVVLVEPRDTDRYGRMVARVRVDGRDLSVALVRAGLAWHFTRYSSDSQLATAELEARRFDVGLWSYPNPAPPWEYRRPVPVEKVRSAGPFHGNRRSRVFHRPGCRAYGCANCTHVFRTAEEAIGAGYRPAEDCLIPPAVREQ